MQTWNDVTADASVREALYLYSGLSYFTVPTAKIIVKNYDYMLGFIGF